MSSIASHLFNRATLKLVVALSIPALIACFFMYSQHAAKLEVEAYKKEQRENPTIDALVVKDYTLKEVDGTNRVRWSLISKQGKLNPETKYVELDDVTVEYYDGKLLKARIHAPRGEADEATRNVKMLSVDKRLVVAEGDGGKNRFQAKQVELNRNNQFLATGGVIIEYPGVAKVTGDSASGKVDLSGPKNFKIVGNTHALITVN
jgi:hypothetical protein